MIFQSKNHISFTVSVFFFFIAAAEDEFSPADGSVDSAVKPLWVQLLGCHMTRSVVCSPMKTPQLGFDAAAAAANDDDYDDDVIKCGRSLTGLM